MIVDGSMGGGGDGVFYGVVNDTVGGDGVGVCFNGGGVGNRFVDPTMAGSREGVCLRVVGSTENGLGFGCVSGSSASALESSTLFG